MMTPTKRALLGVLGCGVVVCVAAVVWRVAERWGGGEPAVESDVLPSSAEPPETMSAIRLKNYSGSIAPLLRGVAPPIDGFVEDIEPDLRLVVLSVGKNDDVKPGFEFTVYRGSRFIAKVQVTKVYDNLSGARILFPDDAVVNKGDRVTTRIN